MKTVSQMEAEISHAIVTFEKQHMGRGPTGIRTHIVEDLVIVRLRGILTPAEQDLARTGDLRARHPSHQVLSDRAPRKGP